MKEISKREKYWSTVEKQIKVWKIKFINARKVHVYMLNQLNPLLGTN